MSNCKRRPTPYDAQQRRQQIIAILTKATGPVSASALAGQLGVSRQIVVGDVALLRAGGEQIDATPRGYVLTGEKQSGYTGLLALPPRRQ